MSQLLEFICIAFYLVQSATGDVFCDKNDVKKAWEQCDMAYQPSEDNHIDVQEMCKNVDCLIQCKIDAVSDCTESDKFLDQILNYDPEKWKVYYRISCSDVTFAAQESKNELRCEANDSFCPSDEFVSKFLYGQLDLYKNGKYEEYKKLLCNTTNRARDCLRVTPSVNCTESNAKMFSDIVKISSSISICDNKDIGHLYTKHGGDVKCVNPKLDSKCFKSSLLSRVSRCTTLSLRTILDHTLPPDIATFCNSQECNIKCYEDAVGDCIDREQFFDMDPVVVKVSNRAACEKTEELKTAVTECIVQNTTCSAEFNKSISEAEDLFQQQNYTEYRQAMCSGISTFLDCMDYIVTGKCTDEKATLLKDTILVMFSYAKCGPQDHAYFSKYSGDTNCVTSGTDNFLTNRFLFAITMLLPVLLYK